MNVVARAVDPSECPKDVQPYVRQLCITTGKVYEVYAMVSFDGVILLQIIDDLGYPSWRPSWFFESRETSIPGDWICNVFHSQPAMIVGPQFVAESNESYCAMVELNVKQVDMFWKRVDALRQLQDDGFESED